MTARHRWSANKPAMPSANVEQKSRPGGGSRFCRRERDLRSLPWCRLRAIVQTFTIGWEGPIGRSDYIAAAGNPVGYINRRKGMLMPPVLRLVLVVVLLASSCSQVATVDAEAAEQTESTAPVVEPEPSEPTLFPGVDPDGLPGFNGLVKNGCVPGVEAEEDIFDTWGWTPISDAVNASNVTIDGTITAISEPRISTLKFSSSPAQFYFRVVEIKVDRSDAHQGKLGLHETVQVPVPGAGLDVDRKSLCYGPDGSRDERERPMEVGSQVVVLGNWTGTPIVGFEGQVLNLPRMLNTFWVVDNGVAASAQPEYSASPEDLWERLGQEVHAKRDGRTLEIEDAFSVPPT